MLAVLTLFLEFILRKVSSKAMLGAILGGIIGLVISFFLLRVFFLNVVESSGLLLYLQRSLSVLCVLTGAMIGMTRLQHVSMDFQRSSVSERHLSKNYKILDTSVIIDGRIADLSETGFLEGVLLIPQFILQELQHIADSADSIKRNRGRRGLEILHKIQKRVDIQVEITEQDFPEIPEIDAKLVELAKLMEAKLITNDFNLNKVAELQGVSVLNVNELANALKPVVLPGEEIEVQVLKEGKEYDQGIAYLDDGTMIVIDHAKKLIGQTVGVSVTSVLQTTAGRMIFGQLAGSTPVK
ncbi:PIN domain nuclease [candidate division KSB3 bacterium]|uniref:PIN domain nuclease n=1 Tax=candidate division KSB3 bacterium TaxID=2044937 RepID=A0A2G6EBM0_9BACT|nr:MAG: PIN domain nuclease [candidate division KSB3 bacterium]PIE30834.1 MAG: PIN domain nuclease [candidate division KSB3 bacterium]